MKAAFQFGLLVAALAGAAAAQTTLHTTTTLVVVPALVREADGRVTFSLTARDFVVTDNGVPQKVTLDEETKPPLSMVVLMQTGGVARLQLASYAKLETMLSALLIGAPNKVSVVNFDSKTEAASPFTSDLAEWTDAINQPTPGDSGAAIFDAIAFALDLLKKEPTGNRRAILLISQERDNGSKTPMQDVVRDLGETNTAIYCLTFSAEKTEVKTAVKGPAKLNDPIQVVPSTSGAAVPAINDPSYPTQGYFDLYAPLRLIVGAMRKNVSAEVASLSGGVAMNFDGRGELESNLNVLTNYIHNTYHLSFSPTSRQPGLHTIEVTLPKHPEMIVSARRNYWADETNK